MTITPTQCRGARAMLGWTQGQLARASKVAQPVIVMFELGKRDPEPHPLMHIQRALENAGIIFIEDNGEGPGLRLRMTSSNTASNVQPTGPATDVVKAMDAAIAENRVSKTKR